MTNVQLHAFNLFFPKLQLITRCILDSDNPYGDMKEVLQMAKSLRLESIVHGVKLFNEIKESDVKSWEIRNDEVAVTVTEDLDLVDEDTMGMGVDTAGNPLLTGDDCILANPGVQHEEVNNNHEIITDDSARIEEITPASVNQDDQSSTTNMMTVTTANSLTDQEVNEFIYANDEFTQICSSLQMPSNDSNLEDSVPPIAVVPPIKLQPPAASVASVQRKPKSEKWVSRAKSNKKPNKRRGRSSTLALGKETDFIDTLEVPGKIKTEVSTVAGDMLSVPNASKCPLCKGSITGSASLSWEQKYQHHLALRHYKHSLLQQYGRPDFICYICDASFYGEETKYVLHLGVHHNLIENLEDKKVIEPLAVENFITEIEPNVIVIPERKESEAFHGFGPEDVDQPVIIEPEERHVHRYNTRGGRSRTEKAVSEEDTKPASQPSKKRKHCCEHCGLKVILISILIRLKLSSKLHLMSICSFYQRWTNGSV